MAIIDYKQTVNDEYNRVVSVINEIGFINKYEKQLFEINELMNKVSPSLMFFGVYNSGKSTLLNSIFGKYVASTADVPETHQVSKYKWNNYELVDTPGIDGPIGDEKVSKPELRKHDVILFVIDDGDSFDSDKVTNEILDIITENKPLILVLNCKQDLSDDAVERKRKKIGENIDKAATLRGLEKVFHKYEFVAVDAYTGYNGKINNDEMLYKESNIDKLEDIMSRKLDSSKAFKMLINPTKMLCVLIDDIANDLKNKIGDSKKEYLIELLDDLNSKNSFAIKRAETLIRTTISKYNLKMYEHISEGTTLEDLNNQLSNEIYEIIEIQSKELCKEIDKEIKTHKIDMGAAVKIDLIEKKEYKENINRKSNTEELDTEWLEKVLDVILFPGPIPIPMPGPIKIPAVVIVALSKAVLSILFGKKNDNRQSIENEINAKREQEVQRQNALQEARTQINNQLYKFENEAMRVATQALTEVYNATKSKIEGSLAEETAKVDSEYSYIQRINNARNELEVLIGKIENN